MENGYFEIWQLEHYGDVLPTAQDLSPNVEDTKMPDFYELEILQKGEE